MKVKMREFFQGREIEGVLEPRKVYDVPEELAAWLVENRKAENVREEPVHYGAQAEPELRHDDEIYQAVTDAPKRKRGRK